MNPTARLRHACVRTALLLTLAAVLAAGGCAKIDVDTSNLRIPYHDSGEQGIVCDGDHCYISRAAEPTDGTEGWLAADETGSIQGMTWMP